MLTANLVGGAGSGRKSWPRQEGMRYARSVFHMSVPVLWATRALHNHFFGQRARRRFGRRGRTEG